MELNKIINKIEYILKSYNFKARFREISNKGEHEIVISKELFDFFKIIIDENNSFRLVSLIPKKTFRLTSDKIKNKKLEPLKKEYQPITRIINNFKDKELLFEDIERLLEIVNLVFYDNELKKFELKKLTLSNYRKYEKEILNFDSKFTLLVGENATGKTTILDGIATSLGGFLQGFNNIKSSKPNIKDSDIRAKYIVDDSGIISNLNTPTELEVVFDINNKNISWKRTKKNIKSNTYFSKKDNFEILSFIEILEQDMVKENRLILPIFSYHGTGRLWEQKQKKASKMENLQRIDGYNDSLEAKSNYRNFLSWFEKLSRHSFEINEKLPVLEKIKDIIKFTLEELTSKEIKNVAYREGDLEIYYMNRDVDRVGQLSDGYRNIIGLVTDIAYRICILNPKIKDNIKNTPGIVLIDEIDLHLHPKWQKQIIGILKELFPNVQFIVTSHSPFIIQSMKNKEIIKLDENSTLTANGTMMSIEDITENIMDLEIPQMSQRKLDMLNAANEYFDILDKLEENKATDKEVKKYKEKLDELSKPYEENMAYVAFLERKRLLIEAKVEKCHETSK